MTTRAPYRRRNIPRDVEIAEMYRAGYSEAEIAKRFDLVRSRVSQILSSQSVEMRRRGGAPKKPLAAPVEVPRWVPHDLIWYYRDLAALEGEERAASVIRRVKQTRVA